MTCSCGAAITAEIKKQKYTYYRCSQLCEASLYVREERITEQFAEVVVRGLQLPPDKLDFARRALKASRVDVVRETQVRLADARARYDRFKRLIDKAYEDKLEGSVDDAFFSRKRLEWEEGMRIAHEDVTRYTRADLNSMNTALELLELVSSAYEAFNRKTPSQQRGLLNLLVSNCELQSGTIKATYREPYDFIAKFADAKNEDGAESLGGTLRHPVWSG